MIYIFVYITHVLDGELIFSQVSGIPEINSDSIQILQYAIKHARPNDDDSWTPVVHLLTELQHRVASFSSSMTEWIQQNIALAMFTRYFAVNTSTTTTTSALWMPASVDDASAELAISIYPNCPTQSAAVVVDRSPIVLLCPLFKLLCMCEERGVGSASGGIETLFHAPLIMYDREQAADEGGPAVQSQRFIAVFYSIQWYVCFTLVCYINVVRMRMLINALGATCSSDQKSICAERLGHLVELERLLEELWPLVDIQFFERSGFVPSLPLKKKQLRDKLWTLLKDRLIAVNHRGLLCLSGCIVESGLEASTRVCIH